MMKIGFIQLNWGNDSIENLAVVAETIDIENGYLWIERARYIVHGLIPTLPNQLQNMRRNQIAWCKERRRMVDDKKLVVVNLYANVGSFSLQLPAQHNCQTSVTGISPIFPHWFEKEIFETIGVDWRNKILF